MNKNILATSVFVWCVLAFTSYSSLEAVIPELTKEDVQEAVAVIEQDGKTIEPIESRPAMKAEPTDFWPNAPAYKAICYYYFPMNKLDPDGKATVVVSIPDQRGARFEFDLSGMR